MSREGLSYVKGRKDKEVVGTDKEVISGWCNFSG